jgi:hypothetical protein
MEFPKMARTSSSFLALPVTKVTGRDNTKPDALAAAAIFPRFVLFLVGKGVGWLISLPLSNFT